ncbi:MAG: transporter [Methyloceanibacter sp.]|nr:MAG: transporter [Methyloceanibacter sp.]
MPKACRDREGGGGNEMFQADRADPTAYELHDAIKRMGEDELSRPSSSVAWSGLAAGLTMGLSLIAEGILRAKLPDTDWRELVSALGYSAGFLFVTLGKQQLYTETTLTVTLPLLHALSRFTRVLRFWAIVFVTNIAGTLIFAFAVTRPGLFPPEFRESFTELGEKAIEGSFIDVLLQGVGAGWVIALMVWILPASGSARFFVIIFATYLIAIGQLAHVIAGSVETSFAAMVGAVTWYQYGVGYIVPALIGNSIGGIVFVAILNHAQAKDSHKSEPGSETC